MLTNQVQRRLPIVRKHISKDINNLKLYGTLKKTQVARTVDLDNSPTSTHGTNNSIANAVRNVSCTRLRHR